MIQSSTVIEDTAGDDEVGFFDVVELYFPEDDETQTVQVVTTVRCDPGRVESVRNLPWGGCSWDARWATRSP